MGLRTSGFLSLWQCLLLQHAALAVTASTTVMLLAAVEAPSVHCQACSSTSSAAIHAAGHHSVFAALPIDHLYHVSRPLAIPVALPLWSCWLSESHSFCGSIPEAVHAARGSHTSPPSLPLLPLKQLLALSHCYSLPVHISSAAATWRSLLALLLSSCYHLSLLY